MKGLLVDTLAGLGTIGCTNGGVSSNHRQFVLTGEGMPEIFEPSERAPELKLVKWYGFFKAVPANPPKGLCGPMFGGNFIYTSDGRFHPKHPVPIHDRFETQDLNDALSQ